MLGGTESKELFLFLSKPALFSQFYLQYSTVNAYLTYFFDAVIYMHTVKQIK